MFFSSATQNGSVILKKCFNVFFKSPIAILLSVLIVLSNSIIFGSILYVEEYYYGVSLFKPDTFYNLLSLPLKTHLFKVFVFLLILLFTIFLNNIFKIALTFYYTKKLTKQKHSFFLILQWSFLKAHLILHLALILITEHITSFFYTLSPKDFFSRILLKLQGKRCSTEYFCDSEEEIIFLPLMVSNNLSISDNLKESKKLMKKTFGESFRYNVSFMDIEFLILLFIAGTFGVFTHYHCNLLPAIILSFFVFIMTFVFLENAILFFKVCVYNHIQKKNIQAFSTKEINSYFVKEN